MSKIPYLCSVCQRAASRAVLYRFAGVCRRCHERHQYPTSGK